MFTVGIIGRANVGKSSLFNALLRRRRTIVFDEAGTTRDEIVDQVNWNGVSLSLVDSQGIFEEGDQSVLESIWRHSDCCLFVVDAVSGPTPFDRWIARLLHKVNKPTLLVVNKCDLAIAEYKNEFSELGFPEMLLVSASQKTNLREVRKWCSVQGKGISQEPAKASKESETPKPGVISVALVGRPNTGKSTLMNLICGSPISQVSPVPLTTRDPVGHEVSTELGRFRLTDTAGIRRPSRKKGLVEVFSIEAAERSIRSADVVFLLVASHEAVTDQDMRLLNVVEREGKPAVILLNFWDILDREQKRVFMEYSEFERILLRYQTLKISGKTGYQVDRCLPVAYELSHQATQRIQTSKLNQMVNAMVSKNPPPMVGRKSINFLYASQVAIKPPTFVFFVNRKDALPNSYRRYVENFLKRSLGLENQSVRVLFRSRSENVV